MSFEALKEQAALLVPDERRRLLAFLVFLEDSQTPDYQARLREKIDDQTPERWLTIEQIDQRLRLNESAE